MGDADKASDGLKRCRCGYARGDGMVAEEPRYSFTGSMALLFGITAPPISLQYKCRKCGEVLGETRDPAELKRHHT